MKKIVYLLFVSLVVVIGVIFANREIKNKTKSTTKPLSMATQKTNMEKKKMWEASPDGIKYKEWEVSPEGKKVHASYDKIQQDIKTFNNMEAMVTSVTFQRSGKSSEIKWIIVKIKGETYMMQFIPKDFEQLKKLKVNDKIMIRSRSAGFSNNHPYLILSGDHIMQNNKILFKRDFSKNKGC
jgi:hypothetical protein